MDQLPSGEWWPDRDRQERVAVVTDPRGWTWEVVAEGREIVALTVRPHPGKRIGQRALSATPLGYLRDAALSYWHGVDDALANRNGAVNVTPAAEAMSAAGGEVGRFIGKPEPEDFARAWAATPARRIVNGKAITRREALSRAYRRPDGSTVSLATIDKWTREGRDLGLIEAATTGAPRDPKTTDGK